MGSGAGTDESSYDLFLSYNSVDHRIVEEVAHKLADAGLKRLFLDRWNLLVGTRWRPMLEKALGSSKAVAIFVGPGEMGSWQQREVDIALDLQSKNAKFPVIPVLLPGCEPPLGFLRQLTWVDLRTQTLDRGIDILTIAARGEAPVPDLRKHLDAIRASICPYRGLLHFREEDAPFFFGRESAIDELSKAVARTPLVAVGASGSGKSSVVRAGLIPRLRRDKDILWEIATLVPDDEPLKSLAAAIVPLLDPSLSVVDRLSQTNKLAVGFASNEPEKRIHLRDVVKQLLRSQTGTQRLLLVGDQWEELYTLTKDDTQRRRFVDELLDATSRAPLSVVLTLRGDFVGKALAYRPLSDRLQGAQVNLGPMNREELERAICKPTEKIHLGFEPGLVRRILNDVGDEPGNLPLLEFVLKELWERRRGGLLLNEAYDDIGGLQGAVATKADEVFNGLSSAEQTILQRVFLRIVSPSESGLDTRRRAAFSELPSEGVELVLKLANERLLVTNQSANEQTVEIAHEALISNWGTLRTWVNEDRKFLLWRARLRASFAEWERAQESAEAMLRGLLLNEAQKWFDQRSHDLSDQERKFISASREERERIAREEKERQERELETFQKLAHAETARAAAAERATQAEEARPVAAEKGRQEQAAAAKSLRRLAWMLAIVALVAGGAAIFGLWQKNNADKQAELAISAEKEAKKEASQANVFLALNSSAIGNDSQELAYLAKALKLNGKNFEAGALAAALLTQESWPVVTGAMKHDAAVFSAQFSPDGQRVVTASFDHTARVWDTATGKALGEPMKHDAAVFSAQFSPDGQRVVTASNDKTARVWDIPTTTRKDSADDANLLADLAEATSGLALQPFGQTEILATLTLDQVKATRDKIAVKFPGPPSQLTQLQRFLKWSVSDRRQRTISPFSKQTVPEWIENSIKEGTLESLRAAIQMDPANARLIRRR